MASIRIDDSLTLHAVTDEGYPALVADLLDRHNRKDPGDVQVSRAIRACAAAGRHHLAGGIAALVVLDRFPTDDAIRRVAYRLKDLVHGLGNACADPDAVRNLERAFDEERRGGRN